MKLLFKRSVNDSMEVEWIAVLVNIRTFLKFDRGSVSSFYDPNHNESTFA